MSMKEFIKNHFSGPVQLYRDFRTLREFKAKRSMYRRRNEQMHAAYEANLKKFKDVHKGERCFIVATGPSLRIEDVNRLQGEYTFGVNSCLTMYDKTDWRASYYGIVDSNAVSIMGERLKSDEIPVFFYSDFDAVYDGANGVAFPKDDADNMMTDTIWKKLFPGKFKETSFSDDIAKVVYTGKSVVYAMLQIAAYMGFSEIYLIGVDCNYAQPKMYSDNVTYVDFKTKWDQARLKKQGNQMLPQYEIARKYADAHGFKIYNATRGGQLEAFERVDFDTLFE
jgi:hypothetical protein